MHNSHSRGFTLIETMVATGVLSILSLMMFAAVEASVDSGRLASAKSRVQGNIRDTLPDLIREVELGARATTAAGINGLAGITVIRDGVAMDPGIEGDMVVFQVPTDSTGANWSAPIQYRFVNEDTNGNGFLDVGEDAIDEQNPAQDGNGDGILTRCILREQDLNADGDFDEQGETRIVGGVNELQAVRFSLNVTGDVLNITVQSSQNLEGNAQLVEVAEGGVMREQLEGQGLVAQANTQVYILN